MMTEKGSLIYGIEYNGKLHYAFEIGLPTLGRPGNAWMQPSPVLAH
ncbi:Uncharacterised protein [Edwardsiella tarda]|nr:Uncharacterised protein [Edwardsiella tarda]